MRRIRDALRSPQNPLRRVWSGLRNRGPLRRRLFLFAVLALTGAAAFAADRYLLPTCLGTTCPRLSELNDYRPPEPPHVYAADGSLAGHLPGPHRVIVSLDDIPPLVRAAFVAVEDRRFREHGGVDLRSASRALWRNLRSGAAMEGASTITMQLVRNLFAEDLLEFSRWRRKASEVRLARTLERTLSKDRILELYLNQIYLGDGVYGIGTAALHYFDRPLGQLELAEVALLVGLARTPERYNPRRFAEAARGRRDVVLGVLEREGVVSSDAAERARSSPVRPVEPSRVWERGSHFAAAVRRELLRIVPEPRLRAGVRIHTALDPALQAAAEESLRWQLDRIEGGVYGPFEHPVPAGDRTASGADASPYLQGMIVAIEASTGAVRALVGGRDFSESEFDRAFLARRQPGSAFKPLVLATVLSEGVPLTDLVSTDSLRVVSSDPDDPVWRLVDRLPAEEEGEEESADERGPLTLRRALVRSSNVAAVRAGLRAGLPTVLDRARALGIETPIPAVPSILLGTAEVVPAQLVAAYAAFENGGRGVRPHLIRRIESPDGEVVWEAPPPPTPALDPGVAFLVRSVLRDVVDRGTGWTARAQGVQGPAAGKTGTTNRGRDVWFVGMRPGLVAGVWLGFDRPLPIVPGATGGRLAAPLWGRMMAAAPDSASDEARWRPPEDIEQLRIDAETGYLATDDCPEDQIRVEYFLPGTVPERQCPLHGRGLFDRIVSGVRGLFGGEAEPIEPPTEIRLEPPRP